MGAEGTKATAKQQPPHPGSWAAPTQGTRTPTPAFYQPGPAALREDWAMQIPTAGPWGPGALVAPP